MPFKSAKKQRAYAQKWRRKNPTYMRDYYRRFVCPYNKRPIKDEVRT